MDTDQCSDATERKLFRRIGLRISEIYFLPEPNQQGSFLPN